MATSLGFALDLSSPQGSFAFYEKKNPLNILFHKTLSGTFSHSEKLLGELEASLKENQVDFTSVGEWVTSRGPGSFTGLRIAFSTLKAFASVTQTPLITVEGPEARALAYLRSKSSGSEQPRGLVVLSSLTLEKYVSSVFEQKGGSLVKTNEAISSEPLGQLPSTFELLVDGRISQKFYSTLQSPVILFELKAQHLCFSSQLNSRMVAENEAILWSVPSYFGSTHFD